MDRLIDHDVSTTGTSLSNPPNLSFTPSGNDINMTRREHAFGETQHPFG